MNQSIIINGLLFTVLALLSACSTVPIQTKPDDAALERIWQQRQAQLRTIHSWQIIGRIAVKTADDAWTATLNWQQQGDEYRIRILAAFHGVYEIKQSAGRFSITTPENERVEAGNAESLMREHLGWILPVGAMKHWIRGLPDQGLPISGRRLSPTAELLGLEQQGWNVALSLYKPYKKYRFPGKLILTNDNAKITILANEWKKVL